ncbi:uncharacterized protein LOC117477184 isoform X2 [Trematomus bernacchii]|uniref:uncharacterized protein LOC117477184 isoform X2 n=1 Tax=Trematomus bernacchii TaxID=40690 RepID=UPI00146C8292|nr:uncharacterized protein LOC117477184 isoform X2 [Trematomus bernacchii]
MAEFKRIQMCSLLILLLQFTGAAIGQRPLFLSVRVGDEATLPCNSVRDDQDQCNGTTWFFRDSRGTAVLVEDGQIDEDAKAKSDRLRVTENCSLGIKKVTEEDAGGYGCRQFRSGEQRRGPGSYVYLSVVTMTEHQDNDEVTLNCSVVPYRRCDHRVKWLLQGRDVDKDHREIKTSQSPCSASVTFLSSLFSYTSRSELFTCEVTYRSNVWTFSPQSSGAAIGQRYLYLSVRVGDEATLPCNSVRDDQDQCNGTTWFFRDSGGTAVLVEDGQIDEDAKAKSDRLRVTENCSLGIKKVTEEDAGRYVCRQFRSGEQQRDPGSYVYLFVVTRAAIGQRYLSVRVGDEATLPCNSVRDDQDQCNGTTWFFSGSGGTAVLVEDGQIDEDAKAKSDRLRVTENCSLGIKKVTEEDAGGYGCRQFRSGEQRRGPGSYVYLSVVTMTEHQDNDEVTLDCSVVPYRRCDHRVKWLLQGRDVDKDHREIKTSQSPCSASVTFLTSLFSYTSRSELFTCEVTYRSNVWTFSPQSSGAAIGQRYLYLSVRVGDEATLPCNSVRDDQDQCNGTTWFFRDSGGTAVLVEDGQIDEDAKAKSDRLRVTENCSLGIKKVTEEDAGRYVCRQFRSGEQQRGPGSYVYLFVLTMTEHQDNDEVTLDCSVVPYRRCDHTVKWLLQGQDVDKDHREIKTSQSPCSASVTFLTSLFSYTTRSELFTCEVTYHSNVWTFSPQSSGAL